MRRLSDDFLRTVIGHLNHPVYLVMVEISRAYVSAITSSVGKNHFHISSNLKVKINNDYDTDVGPEESPLLLMPTLLDPMTTPFIYSWIVTFENGNNVGINRVVSSYDRANGTITLAQDVDFALRDSKDRIRLSKCMFIAMTNEPVDFFLPDTSNSGTDVPVRYMPFPMSFEPVGTSIEGEVLSMKVDVSNVSLLIGNAVQATTSGMRGNRVTTILTFDNMLIEGRTACIEETMYIDSVAISSQAVTFSLETRFNIMSLQLPLCLYNRNFCRWKYNSLECLGNNGTTFVADDMDLRNYPKGNYIKCDHSLLGPNGCVAHKKTITRFGGFPSLSAL